MPLIYVIKRSFLTWNPFNNHIIKTQASNISKILIESIVADLQKENLIINKKTAPGFDSFFQKNAPAREQTISNVILDKS